MRAFVVLALGAAALMAGGSGRATAQGTSPVTVTLSVLAGEQRYTPSPGATGETLVEVPDKTPVFLSAAIEGNLTELGQWQLTVGPANGRGLAVTCAAPCTTTQYRLEGRTADRYSARAIVSSGVRQVATSTVVTVVWGAVELVPEQASEADSAASRRPGAVVAVVVIGVLLVAALVPLSLGRRR